jgi:hypothetical protein
MQAGRPRLIVPAGVETLALNHVVVAWKDTAEARRAISDALPLLSLAGRVTVVEITAEAERDDARAGAGRSGPAGAARDRGGGRRDAVSGCRGVWPQPRARIRAGGITRDLLLRPGQTSLLLQSARADRAPSALQQVDRHPDHLGVLSLGRKDYQEFTPVMSGIGGMGVAGGGDAEVPQHLGLVGSDGFYLVQKHQGGGGQRVAGFQIR